MLSLSFGFGFYKTQWKVTGESSVKIKTGIRVRTWEKITLSIGEMKMECTGVLKNASRAEEDEVLIKIR